MRPRHLLLFALWACGTERTPDPADSGTDTDTVEVPSDESNRDGECGFNRECPADQRCECTDGLCACSDGARGTGVNGVDSCVDGNDCASSLCVEGADDFYCSDECVDNDDCEAALPVCLDVAFVGRICTRESPAR
ncbi:MAG: hypothetical protein EP330_00645 [Deltaproteobacteria bacterium]|nr:MAG: hypothetical protein EP330_00645 [Deltaproteobacteria bacterium]